MAGYQKVLPGWPAQIPAKVYNKLVDLAAGQDFNAGRSEPPFFRNAGIVLVKNKSGADLVQFGVLGLQEPLITVANSLSQFKQWPAFKGVTPTVASYAGKFAIALDPIPNGQIGECVVSGVAIVQLAVAGGMLLSAAEVNDGQTATLENVASGSAQVLWAEDNSAATQWAIVRLGSGGGTGTGSGAGYARIVTQALPSYSATASTLTGAANGALDSTFTDSVTLATGDNLLFVVEGSAGTDYGLYTLKQGTASTKWVLTRVDIALVAGLEVYVSPEGSINPNTVWQLATANPIVPGSTPQLWARLYPEIRPVQLTSGTLGAGGYPGTVYDNNLNAQGTIWITDLAPGTPPPPNVGEWYLGVRAFDQNGAATYKIKSDDDESNFVFQEYDITPIVSAVSFNSSTCVLSVTTKTLKLYLPNTWPAPTYT
jgi:hypothetical protein